MLPLPHQDEQGPCANYRVFGVQPWPSLKKWDKLTGQRDTDTRRERELCEGLVPGVQTQGKGGVPDTELAWWPNVSSRSIPSGSGAKLRTWALLQEHL